MATKEGTEGSGVSNCDGDDNDAVGFCVVEVMVFGLVKIDDATYWV